jgi:hypothetical protein
MAPRSFQGLSQGRCLGSWWTGERDAVRTCQSLDLTVVRFYRAFGTASEDFAKFETVLLIGGGCNT